MKISLKNQRKFSLDMQKQNFFKTFIFKEHTISILISKINLISQIIGLK